MNNSRLIPVVWETLYTDCIPAYEMESDTLVLTCKGDSINCRAPRVFFDDVDVRVEVDIKEFSGPFLKNADLILAKGQDLIREKILKHMAQLYRAKETDFDGMFFGVDRGFACGRTRDGYWFSVTICLGYTQRQEGVSVPSAPFRGSRGLPYTFDTSIAC